MSRFSLTVVQDKSLEDNIQALIMEDYQHLQIFTFLITAVGLLILLLACRILIDLYLRPLDKLAEDVRHFTNRSASGNFDSSDDEKNLGSTANPAEEADEIGGLQHSFVTMQHMLADYFDEINQKTENLKLRQKELEKTYERAQEDQRVKAAFLANITQQIIQPVNAIKDLTATIATDYQNFSEEEMKQLRTKVIAHTDEITHLIDQKLISSQQVQNPDHSDEKPAAL